jgi:tetratricopeptide (TPR) repeat protein
MKHAKKNHAMISAAVLAIVATATVACSSSSGTTTATTGTLGKSGPDSLTDGSRVSSLLQSGLTQADQEKWSAAATSFQNVLAISPGNVYANYDLGVIAQSTGNSNEAMSYYHKAIAANAVYTPAMYNEAILLESSQPQQAIAVYRKIVSIDPRASTAYLRMALVQAEQGDITDAKANDAKAVSIDPALSKYKLPAKN